GDQHLRLPLAFGGEDGALLAALRGEDLRLADAFGGGDGGPAFPLGAQLLFHRVLDRAGWVDGFQFDPVDPDAPLPGGLVQDSAQFGVDLLAGGERASRSMPPITLRSVVTVSWVSRSKMTSATPLSTKAASA